MRASAVGLEVEVLINPYELEKLNSGPLSGILNFIKVNSTITRGFDREIPLKISYEKGEVDLLEFLPSPRRSIYIAEARSVEFIIGDNYYLCLKEKSEYCQRFLAPMGKLMIKVREDVS